jgi:ELMO domain-containing protein
VTLLCKPKQKVMVQFLFYALEVIQTFFSKLVKRVIRFWTNKCEIERICISGGYHTSDMSLLFAKSLWRSRKLGPLSKTVFFPNDFSVSTTAESIARIKKINIKTDDENTTSNTRIIAMNLVHCLSSLKHVNDVIWVIEGMILQKVEMTNTQHSILLEEFWSKMRPGVRRDADRDWGEVGFQGKDPCTDFRGMGILGLKQLVALSKEEYAISMLEDADHPRRYYPFACTGINISSFIVDLLRNRHLHLHLLRSLERTAVTASVNGTELLDAGCVAVNRVYCEVFKLFSDTWQDRDPPNVMHFKDIFSEVQTIIKNKYPNF